MKNLYCFIGPSGAGKDAIVGGLSQKYGYKLLKSYTTRQPRNADDDGHYFISKDDFGKITDVYFSIILVDLQPIPILMTTIILQQLTKLQIATYILLIRLGLIN